MRKHLEEINIGKYQLTGLKDINKFRLNRECQICKSKEGATLKCYIENY